MYIVIERERERRQEKGLKIHYFHIYILYYLPFDKKFIVFILLYC